MSALDPCPDSRPVCPVCYETLFSDAYALPECGHVFHPPCIARWLKESLCKCPVCRDKVKADVLADLGIDIAELQPFPPLSDGEDMDGEHDVLMEILNSQARSNSPTFVPRSDPDMWRFEQSPSNFQYPVSPQPNLWQSVRSRLIADDEYVDSNSSDDEGDRAAPSYYEASTLEFLRKLDLTEEQYNEVIFYKRRFGKDVLCDAVNRVKVFLSLNDHFRFTSLGDMLHQCHHEQRSSKTLDEIYKKYVREASSSAGRPARTKGSAYHFFDLLQPDRPSRASEELERSFRKAIYEVFGVLLPPMRRDVNLLRFYREHSNNLHNVLHYAKLRHEEQYLKRRMDQLKRGIKACKRRRLRRV